MKPMLPVRTLPLILFLLCHTNSGAQDSNKIEKNIYYLSIGGGVGSGYPLQEKDHGISATIELSLQRSKAVYSLGVRGVGELSLFANVNNSIRSFDILYGRAYKIRRFYSSISAGVGAVTTITRGERRSGLFGNNYERVSVHTIGFPISAKALWLPSSYIGLGAEVFANHNNRTSFYGVNFCIRFEKMPSRKKKNKSE